MMKMTLRKINLAAIGRLDFNLDGFFVCQIATKPLEAFIYF